MLRSFHHHQFPVERLVEAKRGRRLSVCLPAKDEEATIGPILEVLRGRLMDDQPLVDEVVVIDDGSVDATARVAADAGAHVFAAAEVLAEYGTDGGKGQAMWKGLHVTNGDIVAFCDADVANFGPEFVTGTVGPLLLRDDVAFVKAFYERPLDGRAGEGGRVTELVARPLISLLFPHLASLVQPLAGECAARREVLEQVPFVSGYGVDLGLLIDVSERFGAGSIVQCDLGRRVHRNRPLSELSLQAMAIIQLALARVGTAADLVEGVSGLPWHAMLWRPGQDPTPVTLTERPSLSKVPAHRKSA
ncbi:MAG TPA: glucosyl-3-phosphoglycerate synthase [Acidimicrobiales bacterium]|jgi:glucosyl-3-phosphoglycerate synthase